MNFGKSSLVAFDLTEPPMFRGGNTSVRPAASDAGGGPAGGSVCRGVRRHDGCAECAGDHP